jgi:hypothetical protein
MSRAIVVPVLLSLTAALASAATLVTSPFSGDQASVGFAKCIAVNLSTKIGAVTIVLHDTAGTALTTETATTVAPGATASGSAKDFTTSSPAWCEFQVANRKAWRGSMFISKTTSSNDASQTVVIPAQ